LKTTNLSLAGLVIDNRRGVSLGHLKLILQRPAMKFFKSTNKACLNAINSSKNACFTSNQQKQLQICEGT
jgi:hypothetical protein